MSLTPQQLPALKAAILAETDTTFVGYRNSGATGAMADWYNEAHATTKGWNQAADWAEVFNAIDAAKYTPTAANIPADTAGTNRMLAILLKLQVQQNLLLALPTVDARDAGTVDAILDSVVQVPSGAAGALTAPGGANGVNVANKLVRPALKGEAIYGGQDVTKGTVTAKVLTYEGKITNEDVVAAINLP